jgi:signal transduction histidine kinase
LECSISWKIKNILINTIFVSITLLLTGLVSSVSAKKIHPDQDSSQSLHTSIIDVEGTEWLEVGWLFHHGDNLEWSRADYDHSSWDTTSSRVDPNDFPGGKWESTGWFRKEVYIDSNMYKPPYGMMLLLSGAAELYVDGKLVHSCGTISENQDESKMVHNYESIVTHLPIGPGHHIFAVRFQNFRAHEFLKKANNNNGFWMWIGEGPAITKVATHRTRVLSKFLYFFTGATIAFGLLHFLLYFYFPAERGNLYYAIHTLGVSILTYAGYSSNFVSTPDAFLMRMYILKMAMILAIVYALRFAYSVFYLRMPRQFWFVTTVAIIFVIFSKWVSYISVEIFTLIVLLEMFRVLIVAIYRSRKGALIVGFGMLMLILAASYQIIGDWGIIPADYVVENVYLYGVMAFLISMSILLAKNSAATKKSLMLQVENVKALSAKTLQQERKVIEQDIERIRLESENREKNRELEVALERQTMVSKLEDANEELRTINRDLHEAQSQLVQSEKMASLGNLVAGIAHEINTPIGAVNSMHDTLLRGVEKLRKHVVEDHDENEPEMKKLVKVFTIIDEANRVINNGIARVTTIVKRLRSFARLDEAEIKEADIEEGLEDTLILIHHEVKFDIEIVREYGKVGIISCYPGKLNQVFLNIIHNARQAMEKGGKITVKTRRDHEYVIVEISDTGCGIEKEHLPKIFDPGFTTKGVKVGTGLGLSISYKIIEEHFGRIEVESEIGKWTTFKIFLPTDLELRVEHT